jgi:hypothetical protein
MKSRLQGIAGFLMLGMSVVCPPVAAATVSDAGQPTRYGNESSAPAHGSPTGGRLAPVSAALGLIGLAMIGVVAIGRRL